ncbi:hypothetical protein [Sporosarcina sp. FA15]|uniref:hypothetical protein n=1 Tax=Sporosarcina sp. FA15 TaxID=3413031 RepID=UPI003F65CE85
MNTYNIDQFIPLSMQFKSTLDLDLNGVWNLVLSCQDWNRGETHGKFARLPKDYLLQRLYKRNDYLIESNHPLKETIIMRTGKNSQQRANYLNTMYGFAESLSRAKWKPRIEHDIGF